MTSSEKNGSKRTPRCLRSGADDPELELAGRDALDDCVRVGDREEDAHAGALALELAEEERDCDGGGAGGGSEHEVAGEVALGGRADVGDDLVLERQHALRAAIQAQARLGRLHSPSRAVEELRAEPLLEGAHLQRDGRLRHTEPLGRL